MDIRFSKPELPKSGVLVLLVGQELSLSTQAEKLDKSLGGAISKAVSAGEFKGKTGQCFSVMGNIDGLERIVLLGTGGGDSAVEKELDIQNLGGKLCVYLNQVKVKKASVLLEEGLAGFALDFVAANLAYGLQLRGYRFDKYFTKKKDEDKPSLATVSFRVADNKEAEAKYEKLARIADGVFMTRDVVSEPPNILYPESYAKLCRELKTLGIKVEVLGEKEMRKLGMGALLGVGQGSVRESQLVVMQWNGAPKKDSRKPIAFVGKGVTFDTGGISIKPALNMDDMKYDMAGSGAVVGLMKALAGRQARVNAVGVIGLVENMPDGAAQRPGDIVTSMSGQTIEVLNTDAEGRLVLADALWYTQDRFQPRFMINLATLTGAIVISLGDQYAGLFSNNDEVSEQLIDAGKEVGENLWRFPLTKEYDKQIDSKVADMQNIGGGRGAGSITAGQFLQRFVNDTPWAHLDIAGMAWAKKAEDLIPEGASGFGVRLLDRLVAKYYES